MVRRTQVLVVGGGPAGATAARRLSQSGIDVVLLEKDLRRRKPCGGGIPSSAFQELGIPLSIPHICIDKIRFISPSNRKLEIPLKEGNILIVDRGDFDLMLRNLASVSGAEILEGEFTSFHSRGRRLASRVLINGRAEVVESDYLISSDGVNSRVRRALDLKPMRHVYTVSSSVEGLAGDACEFWFSSEHAPCSYSWIFPKVGPASSTPGNRSALKGICSVGTGVTTYGRDARLYLERFLKRLNVDTPQGMAIRGYMIPFWNDGVYNIGNILFAGDSAGHVMPFTYEGIYYAMKSGEFAAEAIIGSRPSLYRKLWRRRFFSRFRLMRTLEGLLLRSDERAEKLFDIFSRPDVQGVSMGLWLKKDANPKSLLSYISAFRKLLH